MEKVKVGIIGCGMISEIYIKNMMTKFSNILEVIACADRNRDTAEKRAQQFGIRACTVDELLENKEIEIVVNLTIPAAHYEIAKKTLLAGKHAYSEKPLALTFEEGKELLDLAKKQGLTVASAPDTFLGAGMQTCMELVENGAIGKPVGVQAFMLGSGPERFHPNPGFFYKEGGGPVLDMGPYYYTALAAMFGPAKRVGGFASRLSLEREIKSKESPLYPGKFPCEIDTYVSSTVEFENGVIANLTFSWDFDFWYWEAGLPLFTVFGTEGTLFMPDPNTFGGVAANPFAEETDKVVYLRRRDGEKERIPLKYNFADNSRGVGVADLAACIRNGGNPRVNGEMSLHVLEMMTGVEDAAKTGIAHVMQTTFTKPERMREV